MTDKAKWASDVTNAIAGIAKATSLSVLAFSKDNLQLGITNHELLEQWKAVLEALLKDGV